MGIGPEVTARALRELDLNISITLMGDESTILAALDEVGLSCTRLGGALADTPGIFFLPIRSAEPAPVAAIRRGAEACLAGDADALVTGPIHKAQLVDQGFAFMGHTDMLGSICGRAPVMAFAGGSIRVALVTTHMPLNAVTRAITDERVEYVLRASHAALESDLGLSNPLLAVCGLNPHAGESGKLGDTEQNIVRPVVERLKAEGMRLVGPMSAETAFMDARRGSFDLVVAMYHDQGLVPLKVLDFGQSVNWTLGIPIVRTSVDHGTAESLVGTGKADHSSMVSAIRLAMQIVENR